MRISSGRARPVGKVPPAVKDPVKAIAGQPDLAFGGCRQQHTTRASLSTRH
jgi:hypothetical protein